MEKQELLERISDLFNYVQAVRNNLSQVDSAIERLKIYAETNIYPKNTSDLSVTYRQQLKAAISLLKRWISAVDGNWQISEITEDTREFLMYMRRQ